VIAQRNLSLLANRLFREHGGRRIPEAVLERDYCLAWFLVGLSGSQLKDLLIFKGGTALKRCQRGGSVIRSKWSPNSTRSSARFGGNCGKQAFPNDGRFRRSLGKTRKDVPS
jgi:hypothetical protein